MDTSKSLVARAPLDAALLRGLFAKVNRLCLLKSVVYRVYSVLATFIVALIATGNVHVAAYIGLFDSLVKVFTYYAFDEVWTKTTSLRIKPGVVWLTGLSGAGKTTIAHELIREMKAKGLSPILLDGDEIRNAIKLTGFDDESRRKHNLNVGYIASLFEKQGCVVIVALISPYEEVRKEVRAMCVNFTEVYVSTPLEVCINRDPKGLYKKALAQELTEFTGISAPYQQPVNPELRLDTSICSLKQCTSIILNHLRR